MGRPTHYWSRHHESDVARLIRRRLRWLHGVMLLVLASLGGRLVQLQVVAGPRLQTLAVRQAARGSLYDRNGRPLVINVKASSVYADPAMVQDAEATAALLARVIGRRSELRRQLAAAGRFVWIARRIDRSLAGTVEQMQLPGIGLIPEDRRAYPNGSLAGHVVGFTGVDAQGLAGVELAYDALLAGRPGTVHVLTDALGRELVDRRRVVTPDRPGRTLILTLDAVIQHIPGRELAAAVRSRQARRGIAILMDPRTGEILALAVHPVSTRRALTSPIRRAGATPRSATSTNPVRHSRPFSPLRRWKPA